jgi:hypothetical protein
MKWSTKVVITHHHHRVMMPPEAPCESKGSFIRLLWDCRQGRISAGDMGDRVLLAQAGVRCCGAPRDEVLVNEVARLYEETTRYKANPGPSYSRGGVYVEMRNVESLAIANRGGNSCTREDGGACPKSPNFYSTNDGFVFKTLHRE